MARLVFNYVARLGGGAMVQLHELFETYADKDRVLLSQDPLVAVIDNFLSAEESAAIIERAADKMLRAKVSLDKESVILPGRTGKNCWLRYAEDSLIKKIGERVSTVVGLPLEHAESLQVLHYGANEEYRSHYDAYDLRSIRGERCCRYGGQRIVTAILYLSDVEEGGETAFPKLELDVSPAMGRLVIFTNVGEDQTRPHPASLHAGMPVKRGEKWAANLWFHARPMYERQEFKKLRVSKESASGHRLLSVDSRVNKKGKSIDYPFFCLKTNRASRVFKQALELLEADYPAFDDSTLFTYWDTFGLNEMDLSGYSDCQRVIQLVPRQVSNPLGDKRKLAQSLKENHLSSWVPTSYESVEEALKHPNYQELIWFVKPIFGSGGKGIFCVRGAELDGLVLEKNYILQEGVEGIELLDGKKFTSRVYCLIWNKKLYLYKDGFIVVHGVDYVENSTDYAVQVDHRGYERGDGAVTLLPSQEYEKYCRFLPEVQACIHDIEPLMSEVFSASDMNYYLVLGLDFIFLSNGSVKLIEMNTMPNFMHSNKVNKKINVPFWRSVMKIVLGGDADDFIPLHN